jgi:F-type H+-transporting ATPase subunit beta
MPSAVGYQPTLLTEMGSCRSASLDQKGSITSCRRSTCRPTTTPTRRRPRRFAHLDATTNLSRQIAELGIYPRSSPLASTSRILDPRISARSTTTSPAVKQILQRYKDLQDIIAILGIDELIRGGFGSPCRGHDNAQDPALSFPHSSRFFVAGASSPGSRAKYVPLADSRSRLQGDRRRQSNERAARAGRRF